jgi:hypothetical protein
MYFWRRGGGGGEDGKERQKSNRTSLSSFGSGETRMCVSSRWGGSLGGCGRELRWVEAEVPEQPVCAWACGVNYLNVTIIAEVALG